VRSLFRRNPDAPAVRRAEPFLKAAAGAARRLGHGYVGTEHLLLALAGELGMSAAEVEADVVARVGSGAARPHALDADALATLGIDLDEVRRRVDQAFGAGALDRAAEPCLRMTPRLKEALALAVAQGGDDPLRAEDVLAVLRSIDCLAARILAARAA
jgi:ATP-dependent Clp protease ATP-binding subunit ClpA